MENKYYLVTIEETLSRTMKVKANSLEEAERKVEAAYNPPRCEIVLDADDHVETSFTPREVDEEWDSLELFEEIYEEDFDDSEAWQDDSDRGCSDCPPSECTGHCMSCSYRPI